MKNSEHFVLTSIMYNYDLYKEKSVTGRYIRHKKVSEYLSKIKKNNQLEINTIGKSFKKRDIDLIKIGNGKTKVLFWSQMHGDESTSTRAILDLLNFFISEDENEDSRRKILDNITLYIIPMLNPDGAENFTRRNSQQIDINRDAIAQQSPEGKLLYKIKNEINPDFGFNLHDQSSGYSAGMNHKSSTISLLAPPFNQIIQINETRKRAMKIIVSLYEELNKIIPGHIARYDDEFEPRAFGDNFTKDGISTILIEAGGWGIDTDREFVRKLFFTSLMKSLLVISENSFNEYDENVYFEIPENKERLFDLLLRNISVKNNEEDYFVDIAIKREACFDELSRTIFYKGIIADVGDLSTFFGYEEINMNGYTLIESTATEKTDLHNLELLNQGVIFRKEKNQKKTFTTDPINYYLNNAPDTKIIVDGFANFALKSGEQIKFVVINGYLIDLTKSLSFQGNGLIFS